MLGIASQPSTLSLSKKSPPIHQSKHKHKSKNRKLKLKLNKITIAMGMIKRDNRKWLNYKHLRILEISEALNNTYLHISTTVTQLSKSFLQFLGRLNSLSKSNIITTIRTGLLTMITYNNYINASNANSRNGFACSTATIAKYAFTNMTTIAYCSEFALASPIRNTISLFYGFS